MAILKKMLVSAGALTLLLVPMLPAQADTSPATDAAAKALLAAYSAEDSSHTQVCSDAASLNQIFISTKGNLLSDSWKIASAGSSYGINVSSYTSTMQSAEAGLENLPILMDNTYDTECYSGRYTYADIANHLRSTNQQWTSALNAAKMKINTSATAISLPAYTGLDTAINAAGKFDYEVSQHLVTIDLVAADLKIFNDASAADQIVVQKKTITCIKGKKTQQVSSISPKCPAGWKKK